MITVLTPATATRLTTVAAVRERFGITLQDAADAVVEGMIDVASRMAVEFCNRTFGRETVKQIDISCRRGSGIFLERSPATVTAVSEGGQAVAPEGYYLDAERNTLVRLSDGRPAYWSGETEITYATGWILPGDENATLPVTIEHAALLLIGAMWSAQQRDPLAKSESVEGVGRVDYFVPGANTRLPDPQAELLLQPYRRYL